MCDDCLDQAYAQAQAAEEALDEIRDFVFDPLNIHSVAYSEIRDILMDYSASQSRDY